MSNHSPRSTKKKIRTFGTTRLMILTTAILALVGSITYTWMTRDALSQLAFLRQHNANRNSVLHKAIVSIEPWQTAQTLLPMAVTAEEQEMAHEADRLSDHVVDQAFAETMRLTKLKARHVTLPGDAQSYSDKVTQFEQIVRQDQQQVKQLGGDVVVTDAAKKNSDAISAESDDLQLARAQLNLDEGELSDARKQLAILSGDHSDEIQQELTAYHLAQQQAESQAHTGAERAVASAKQRRTLLMRLQAWKNQNDRTQLLQQAAASAASEEKQLIGERAALQSSLSQMVGKSAEGASGSQLQLLKDRNSQRQILSILDDRIQTDHQLAAVYQKWIAQVGVQHRILMHMILEMLCWVFAILIVAIVLDAVVKRLLESSTDADRLARTISRLLRLAVQASAGIIIMLIVFGVPEQLSTMLGLTTAALTIALQDFILAFLGWFLLMGRNGVHPGDWVEINGVHGEILDVGLFHTTMLELGSLAGKGHPTGRHISFVNSYAIRGQFFNFSTSSQWMWDDVSVNVPKSLDVHQTSSEIEQLVREKTAESTAAAAKAWLHVARGSSLTRLGAEPSLSMRPVADGAEITVHYVTRAAQRSATRDELNLALLKLLESKQA